MNDEHAALTRRRPLSIWDLPTSLLKQPHNFRKRMPKQGRERSHHAAILAFIYRNRFATASQIQRRFAEFLKSDRTARRHLAEMQEALGYLDSVPTPSPLWPKIYSVSWRGMRKLAAAFRKKQPSWQPPVNDRRRIGFSIHHVYHELACTEFLLQVFESAKASSIELLEMQRRSLVKNDSFCLPVGLGNRLVPDGLFLLRIRHGMICTFLEMDTGSMSQKSMAEKLRRYAQWAESGSGISFVSNLYRNHGAANPRPRFRVAIVCGGSTHVDDEQRLNAVSKMAEQLPASFGGGIWLTTTKAARDATDVLQRSIWCRVSGCGDSNREIPFLDTQAV